MHVLGVWQPQEVGAIEHCSYSWLVDWSVFADPSHVGDSFVDALVAVF